MVKRIVIADDHPFVREGLKHILSGNPDYQVAAEVSDGNELLKVIREEHFDIGLIDLFMPGKNGIELIQRILSEKPKIRILVVSTHKEDIFAVRVIKAGAVGYICKDYAASILLDAVKKVAAGGLYISPKVAEQMALALNSQTAPLQPHNILSNREYQVFLMMANGNSLTDIAKRLNLSVKTISTNKTRIIEKMSLKNTSEFIRYAIENGLI